MHNKQCPYVENIDLDISGLPCIGSSTMGCMKGEDDRSSQAQFFVHQSIQYQSLLPHKRHSDRKYMMQNHPHRRWCNPTQFPYCILIYCKCIHHTLYILYMFFFQFGTCAICFYLNSGAVLLICQKCGPRWVCLQNIL